MAFCWSSQEVSVTRLKMNLSFVWFSLSCPKLPRNYMRLGSKDLSGVIPKSFSLQRNLVPRRGLDIANFSSIFRNLALTFFLIQEFHIFPFTPFFLSFILTLLHTCFRAFLCTSTPSHNFPAVILLHATMHLSSQPTPCITTRSWPSSTLVVASSPSPPQLLPQSSALFSPPSLFSFHLSIFPLPSQHPGWSFHGKVVHRLHHRAVLDLPVLAYVVKGSDVFLSVFVQRGDSTAKIHSRKMFWRRRKCGSEVFPNVKMIIIMILTI